MGAKEGKFDTENKFWDAVMCEVTGGFTRSEPMISDMMDMSDVQVDNSGQLVIYTNWWRWNDGTVRNTQDPTWKDD